MISPHDLVHVALRFDLGIDAVDAQTRHVAIERSREVRSRVGGAEVNGLASLDQPQRQRSRDRRLADTALAHHHDQPVPCGRQFIGKRGQPLEVSTWAGRASSALSPICASTRCR